MGKEARLIRERKIALVGTPNSGKTSLFNALTGLNQHVGNFPGVTVDRKAGRLRQNPPVLLIDLPGANSLYPNSSDEAITTSVLRDPSNRDHPDLVVVVVDATQLRRGILLCSQVMDQGFPTVLVLNMMDLVARDGEIIRTDKLSQVLGIPVVETSARKGNGIANLKSLLLGPLPERPKSYMRVPDGFSEAIRELKSILHTDSDYLAYQAMVQPAFSPKLNGEGENLEKVLEDLVGKKAKALISNEMLVRLDKADSILDEVRLPAPTVRQRLTEKVDRILTHRIFGYPILIAMVLLIFQSIFSWAQGPMDAIDMGFATLKTVVAAALPAHWLTHLLTEGIITGLGGIVIFVPQIALLFFFISLMEESGYMSRVVFLMDRIMRPFGFSGKSVIPLMGGMACAIPSIMMSRNIPNRQERLITILVTPLMSCSARIPVYTLLIAMFVPRQSVMGIDLRGIYMTGLYLLGFATALLIAWILKRLMRYDSNRSFVMEMPPYRIPGWKNVGLTVWQKSSAFVREAGKIILAISIVLWFLVSYGPTGKMDQIDREFDAKIVQSSASGPQLRKLEIQRSSARLEVSFAAQLGHKIEPLIRPLGFDWKIGISLITSFAAREVFVSTMSIIYQQEDPGSLDPGRQAAGRQRLIGRMQAERDPLTGEKVYSHATILALLIFYAFAMQCMSTLAVTQREAGWKWVIVMLAYLTALAYSSSFLTYQLFS